MSYTNRAGRVLRLTLPIAVFAAACSTPEPPPSNVPGAGGEIASPVQRGMKAYRMAQGFRGAEHARELASRLFGGTRPQLQLKDDSAGGLSYVDQSDPSAFFRIDRRTGDYSFSRSLRGYYGGGATPGLPDSAHAVALALARLRELGELPAGDGEMVVRHVGGLRMSEQRDDAVRTVDKLVTVYFGRQLDGVDVGGPGSKIVVTLGENGELVALHRRWISLQPEAKRPAEFRSASDVRSEAAAHLRTEWPRARQVAAAPPDLGYYDDGHGNIEPAYFIVASLAYGGEEPGRPGHTDRYLGVVPALREPRADFRQEERAPMPPRAVRDSMPRQ